MDPLIVFGAKYLFLAVLLVWLVAWFQANRKLKIEIIVASVVAGIIAAILDKLASKLYYDPRPFATHNLKPLVNHVADNGFPSEHTLFSITLATVIFFYRPRLGMLAFAVAIIVGISRVAAHVHSPIDIIGGIVFGAAAGYMGYLLAPKLIEKLSNSGNR
jgi:undecaprenyl-diphosphatase